MQFFFWENFVTSLFFALSGDDERQKRIEKVQQNRAKKLVQLQKQTGVDMGELNSVYPRRDSPNTMDKLCSIKVTRLNSAVDYKLLTLILTD